MNPSNPEQSDQDSSSDSSQLPPVINMSNARNVRTEEDDSSSDSNSYSDGPMNGDEEDVDPDQKAAINALLVPLELKKRILELSMEIKSLESVAGNLDETLEKNNEKTQISLDQELADLETKPLERQLRTLATICEIRNLQSLMPVVGELIELSKKRDKMALERDIAHLKNQRRAKPLDRKRKRLESEWAITTLEGRMSDLPEIMELQRDVVKNQLQHELSHLQYRKKRQRLAADLDQTYLKLATKDAKLQLEDWVEKEPVYLDNPVRTDPQTGHTELVMSDRIINLSGPITYRTADHITERIHYYNNKHPSHPIFLVIDYSPGGSVMAGYCIVETMRSSSSPVYVVVKSFAASMAATITTLADHSFVYPNAIILHHQIWSRGAGNLVQTKEALADLEEWWKRLAVPLIEKVGVGSTEEWIKLMYKHNSDGDWREFGDQAVNLKWAGQVVHRVQHTGDRRNPDWFRRLYRNLPYPTQPRHPYRPHRHNEFDQDSDDQYMMPQPPPAFPGPGGPNGPQMAMAEKEPSENELRDLPPLRPMDYYWIYNPRNYYQTA